VACALAVLGSGCQGLTTSAGTPVAIEFVLDRSPVSVEAQDTVIVGVRVLDRAGDTIPGAPVRVVSLNPDTVGVDSALAFGLIGLTPNATGRVVAIADNLQSDPLSVAVLVRADSLALVGSASDTVAAADSVSDSLAVQLQDRHTDTTQVVGLTLRQVTFAIVAPVFDSLGAATATLANDSLTAVVLTGAGPPTGVAIMHVRRRGPPPQPDSVVVEARVRRASGVSVPGSPVRFVVYFQ
jgi:hypothetical protein